MGKQIKKTSVKKTTKKKPSRTFIQKGIYSKKDILIFKTGVMALLKRQDKAIDGLGKTLDKIINELRKK